MLYTVVIVGSASLRVLDVSSNPIGDDGISLISSELQYNNVLTKLKVAECGLSTKGIFALCAYMHVFCLLITYHEPFCIISKYVCLLNSLLILIGAICISEVFLTKTSLRCLNMSRNNIYDGGITAIAGALSHSLIDTLCVDRCGITFVGAQSLAAGLLVNNSLKRLELQENYITVEGTHLILQSAVDNENFQTLKINESYSEDDEVKKMMKILKNKETKEVCTYSSLLHCVLMSS